MTKEVAKAAILGALDLTYDVTKDYTNKTFYEELKGIADGSGVDYNMLRGLQLIGELTKGSCSMFGSWGKASANNHTI